MNLEPENNDVINPENHETSEISSDDELDESDDSSDECHTIVIPPKLVRTKSKTSKQLLASILEEKESRPAKRVKEKKEKKVKKIEEEEVEDEEVEDEEDEEEKPKRKVIPARKKPNKAGGGRPKGSKTKPNIVYVMVDDEGKRVEVQEKKISMKDLKQLTREKEALAADLEFGKILRRRKNGSAIIPKPRSEKQLANDIRLGLAMKAKRGLEREKKAYEATRDQKESLLQALKEVVSLPKAVLTQPSPQKSFENMFCR